MLSIYKSGLWPTRTAKHDKHNTSLIRWRFIRRKNTPCAAFYILVYTFSSILTNILPYLLWLWTDPVAKSHPSIWPDGSEASIRRLSNFSKAIFGGDSRPYFREERLFSLALLSRPTWKGWCFQNSRFNNTKMNAKLGRNLVKTLQRSEYDLSLVTFVRCCTLPIASFVLTKMLVGEDEFSAECSWCRPHPKANFSVSTTHHCEEQYLGYPVSSTSALWSTLKR